MCFNCCILFYMPYCFICSLSFMTGELQVGLKDVVFYSMGAPSGVEGCSVL